MDSPFTQHFDTNYVLSDEEVPAIRDIINKGEEALEGIDQRAREIEGLVKELQEEVKELQEEVKELQQERRALAKRRKEQRREVDEHKALVSRRGTIRRLNHDVLTSIFCVLLDITQHPKISPKHPAIVISQVCQQWRRTALSTPSLWCHLHVRLPDYPSSLDDLQTWNVKVASLVAMTEVWISRCCDGHVSFRFNEGTPTWREIFPAVAECAEFQCLMDTLCSVSPRWKHLVLGFYPSEFPNFPTWRLLAVPPQASPVLTSVELYRLIYGHSQEVRQQVSECLSSATSIWHTPTLRSLEIETGVMFHDIMHMPVVWSYLEHLTLGGEPGSSCILDAVQALALFKECPNLVTCHLRLDLQSHATVPTDSTPIALQQLRELSLWLYDLPKGFAQSLILPSLCEFEVFYILACAPQDHQDSGLGEFLERFGATLLDVTLPYTAFTQPAFRQCLQHLANVTSLKLHGGYDSHRTEIRARDGGAANIDRDILTRLTPQFDEAGSLTQLPLCPSLEVLGLAGRVRIDKNAEAAFVEFIAARRLTQNHLALKGGGKVTRLRRVYVHRFFEFRAIDPNRELRRRGVDMKDFSSHSLSGSGRIVERFLVNLGEL